MNTNRRNFLKGSLATAGALTFASAFSGSLGKEFDKLYSRVSQLPPSQAASDEDFWGWVQQQYTVSVNLINLNNGGVNPQPKIVQDAFIRFYQLSNEGPSYYMWHVLDQGRESLRKELANLAGCSHEEIVIDRNSTEALETIIFGLPLKAGDEIVLCKYDYPNMMNACKQREKRDGIKLVWVDLELPIEDDNKIVDTYKSAFTTNTKVVLITHMINWSGQILPAKKIAQAAHDKGIEVILDGAQTFAHIEYKISDLDCDYYGTSLHKWLGAPFGTGMLYVKKDKIKNLYPLFAANDTIIDDIHKFEVLGTRNFGAEHAIGEAIKFHQIIGSKRKEERFRYLKNYWVEKVKDIPKVKIHTSLKPQYSCGIAVFSIEGVKTADIVSTLFSKYGIHCIAIEWEKISGIRISPNLYNTTHELDILVNGIKDIASK